jgi:molecular chaperone IbpA
MPHDGDFNFHCSEEDVTHMRTVDFAPLYRSSIGFDRLFDLLETANRAQPSDNWPPYDTLKTGEDTYRITMAVAGFAEGDLTITQQPNLLIVTGEKKSEVEGEYLHRGIAYRPFNRRFELADHVRVAGASILNGLLTIDLKREVPEAMKPRQIQISTGTASTGTTIEHQVPDTAKAA